MEAVIAVLDEAAVAAVAEAGGSWDWQVHLSGWRGLSPWQLWQLWQLC